MTSGPIIMGLDQPARSHRAPDTRRETNIIDLAGRPLLRQVDSVARSRGKDDRASFYPATVSLVGQRGDRLSETLPPAGGWAAKAGSLISGQGNGPSHSFSTRAALKLSQIADTAFNVASGLLIAFFVILYFLSPFIALGCLIIA